MNEKKYAGDYLFVISIGRSGSTLLQGLLNSIDGYLIKGENKNFMEGLFIAYERILMVHRQGEDKLSAKHPFYGMDNICIDDYFNLTRSFSTKLLFPEIQTDANLNCIGFKEISYFSLLESDDTSRLTEYLEFMLKVFPNAKVIFLTRDSTQLLNSGWWSLRKDKTELKIKMQLFSQWMKGYASVRSESCFQLDYSDLVEHTKVLAELFGFIGKSYNYDKVSSVLNVYHGYNGFG